MQVSADRLRATATILPRVVQLTPVAITASAGMLVLGFVSGAENAVWHGRIAGMVVAVACAALLDDTASPTLASSPTPVVARRAIRVTFVALALSLWWPIMLLVMSVRTDLLPVLALTRELVILAVMAMVGALVVQRQNCDGKGSVGGVLAIGWFGLSVVSLPDWVPLPPNSLDPDAAGALTVVLLCAVAAMAVLSRDPAAQPLSRRR